MQLPTPGPFPARVLSIRPLTINRWIPAEMDSPRIGRLALEGRSVQQREGSVTTKVGLRHSPRNGEARHRSSTSATAQTKGDLPNSEVMQFLTIDAIQPENIQRALAADMSTLVWQDRLHPMNKPEFCRLLPSCGACGRSKHRYVNSFRTCRPPPNWIQDTRTFLHPFSASNHPFSAIPLRHRGGGGVKLGND